MMLCVEISDCMRASSRVEPMKEAVLEMLTSDFEESRESIRRFASASQSAASTRAKLNAKPTWMRRGIGEAQGE